MPGGSFGMESGVSESYQAILSGASGRQTFSRL